MAIRVRELTVSLWLAVVKSQLEYSCGGVCGKAENSPVEGKQDDQESRAQVSLM